MSSVAPLGPPRIDPAVLPAADFEALCVRLARLEAPDVTATGAPDGGADALLANPNGGYLRAWQAKNHRRRIDWRKCGSSLDRAVENYGVSHFTFCFSVDLTVGGQGHLDKLRARHAGVRVDHWGASEIVTRLTETEAGRRVARTFFEDPERSAELITRAVRAGGELHGVDQVVERVHAVGDYMDGDAYFAYPFTHYPVGAEPPKPPGTLISVEYPDGGRIVRVDAVPRDAEAAERYPARMEVALPGPEAERLEQARLRGEVLHLDRGAEVTFQSLPPAFAKDVGRAFDAELRIDFTPDPWTAEFRAMTAAGEQSFRVTMEPVSTTAEWDRGYAGRFGGLTISVMARLDEGREGVAVNWTHRSDGSPAREQLAALRFLAAMHEDGEFVMCECEEGRRLLGGPNDPVVADARLPALLSLFTDVVSIEDWIGADLKVPAEISAEDLRTIAQVAHAVRAGKAQFAGTFELIGDVEVLPQLEDGHEMDIGEDWVVEIFGEEVLLGRRTVHFRPVAVRRGELVAPGRQAVEIEPGPFAADNELWWTLARPELAAGSE